MYLSRLLGGLSIAVITSTSALAVPLINEFRPNPPGGDPAQTQFEILGTPGEAFSGVITSIESDAGLIQGTIDRRSEVSGTFDANGLLVFLIGDLENPSFTVVLSSIAPDINFDVDTNNDGVADDISGFGTVFDAISIVDSNADEASSYGEDFGGTNFSFTGDEPGLVFRDSVTQELFAINDPAGSTAFRADGTEVDFTEFSADPSVATFGAANVTAIPLPAGLPLMLAGLAGLALFRRR